MSVYQFNPKKGSRRIPNATMKLMVDRIKEYNPDKHPEVPFSNISLRMTKGGTPYLVNDVEVYNDVYIARNCLSYGFQCDGHPYFKIYDLTSVEEIDMRFDLEIQDREKPHDFETFINLLSDLANFYLWDFHLIHD